MENLLYNISQVLGTTIIHSLWQGLLVYLVLRIIFAGIPSLTAVKKYNLAVSAMLAVAACFFYTLFVEVNNYSWVTVSSGHNTVPLLSYLSLSAASSYRVAWYSKISAYLPYVCVIYFTGLTINFAKLAMEWAKVRQIKRSVLPAGRMQEFFNNISKKLSITKTVELKFTELIDVPCVIGYFKPIVLLPVTICTRLSADEVEAILLHELSHIKRNDYLINLLQQLITVLLFFNPFTLLINRIINQERENGCDDMVVEKTGEPLIYAQALIKLEESRRTELQLALAATGSKFHLLNRIERIMKTQKNIGNVRHLIIALFLITGTLSCVAWFNPKNASAASKKIDAKFITQNDSTNNAAAVDTGKNKHKNKAVAKNSKHTSNSGRSKASAKKETLTEDYYGDQFLSDTAKKFFNSAEWKTQMDQMKKMGEQMKKQFDSPEWKEQMLAMKKQGEQMKKQFESPEWKAQMEDMKNMGEKMKKQFDSPEWKAQMEQMKKMGEKMKKQFDSPEWKAQMEQMKKMGEKMQKQFDSPEWKEQMEQMKKAGEKMQKQFDSPEWKAQMKELKELGKKNWILKDSVNHIYAPATDTVKEKN
ncbi:MAG TPA: M56 family metallopeptidase [Mucilaginibacter sp.]|nr:M56 family metallopeptidase [Mucilaginibacter sp.]